MHLKDKLLHDLDLLVEATIPQYLEHNGEQAYPVELIEQMRSIGLFGANTPSRYGGLQLAPSEIREVTEKLASGWQSLAGLLGTHFRACMYVLKCGTERQQKRWLPLMSAGSEVWAHAYHEQGNKSLGKFHTKVSRTRQNEVILTGHKDWVTNAINADRFIVVASERGQTRAAVVAPANLGLFVSEDLPRLGMLGISLCAIDFRDVAVATDDILGGPTFDVAPFIAANEPGSSIAFATRALGTAKAVYRQCLRDVRQTLPGRSAEATGAIALRVGELRHMVSTIDAVVSAVGDDRLMASAHEAKVFATNALQDVIRLASMLSGGSAYASTTYEATMSRHVRDGAALLLIDTPNDVLLSRSGSDELGLRLRR